MATDVNANRHGVNIGSGRVRLPETPQFDGIMFGPGFTSAERMALDLDTSDAGLVVYDNEDKALVMWTGAAWKDVDSSAVAAQPTFVSVSPTGGAAAGGTTITITGTNLSGTTGVTVGGVAATAVTVVDDTHVTCVTGPHAAGAVAIVLTTRDGSFTAAAAYTYA